MWQVWWYCFPLTLYILNTFLSTIRYKTCMTWFQTTNTSLYLPIAAVFNQKQWLVSEKEKTKQKFCWLVRVKEAGWLLRGLTVLPHPCRTDRYRPPCGCDVLVVAGWCPRHPWLCCRPDSLRLFARNAPLSGQNRNFVKKNDSLLKNYSFLFFFQLWVNK